jgi:type I restriction enzyme S subunit
MTDSVRLRWLLTESDARAGAEAERLPLLSVSISWGVRRRRASDSTTRVASEDLSNYKLCRAGNLVINRMRAFQGALGIAPEDGVVSPDYAVLRVDPTVDKRWLNYFLTSGFTVAKMASLVRGIGGTDAGNVRTPRLNVSDLQSMTAPLVAADEQRAIAAYLDRETGRIDTLIEEQHRLVRMLRERRADLISHAVLDVTSERTQLRRLVDVIDCAHVTAEFVDHDRRFPVASIRECQAATVDLSGCNYTTAEFFEHLRAANRAPRAGDLLFIRNVSVGLTSVVTPDLPEFAIGQETVLLRRKTDVHPAFLRYALVGAEARHAIDRAMIGSTFRRINVSAIRSLPVPAPPIDEQQRIAACLDQQTAKIDTLIEETERFIEFARERRAALITAAVTGQIDVREMV